MTYRDNEVIFSLADGYTLIDGSFTIESFSITDGQDPDRHIYPGLKVVCDGSGKMTFSIGRKGSDTVADWFNTQISASQNTFNHTAGDLNFALIGTLELTLTGGILGGHTANLSFPQIALAQGRDGFRNNWWFGGKGCTCTSKNLVTAEGVNAEDRPVTFDFSRGGNGVNEVGVDPVSFFDTTTWMGELKGDRRLDELVMPGSHDAGMSELHHCAPPIGAGGITQTQSENIGQQLASGSRYFDIRVDYDHGELVTYHRTGRLGCNGEPLKTVLDQTVGFLNKYPSETAILKFSHIRDFGSDHNPTVIKQRINDLLNDYTPFIYTNTNPNVNLPIVTLSEVRGRMILVFDYDQHIDPSTGRFRYHDGSYPRYNLTVFDQYSNTSSYNTMSADQIDKWQQHGGLGQGFFFLLSWTLTAGLTTPSVKDLSRVANGNLPNVLYDQIAVQHFKKPNIVYIDYVNSKTTQSIIVYNFR